MAFKKAVDQAKSEAETETKQQPRQNEQHFQQSAEVVGEGILDTLTEDISNPLGDAISDTILAQGLRRAGENLRSGKKGPLTEQMLASLSGGFISPFSKRKAEIENWYKPIALLPSSSESIPS
ncbi:hypothetical protein H6G36_25630 [Anabaena minutissima FACHB-250]|nr:hypothetical protein [Anabaena minutissima FACHB-250]